MRDNTRGVGKPDKVEKVNIYSRLSSIELSYVSFISITHTDFHGHPSHCDA